MATKVRLLYRYEDFPIEGGSKVVLTTYTVVKSTPKGFWLVDKNGKKRWMCRTAKYPFASDNKAFALARYVRRKQRQHQIVVGQLKRVRGILNTLEAMAENFQGEESIPACGLICRDSRSKPKFLEYLERAS